MPSPSLPPLLRGLGTSLLLLSAALTVWYERMDGDHGDAQATLALMAPAERQALLAQLERLDLRVEQDSLADEVFENVWFQWLSLLGTGLIAASFFVESRLRRGEIARNSAADGAAQG